MSAASSSRMSTPESRCSARAAGSRSDFAAPVASSTPTHACRPRLISRRLPVWRAPTGIWRDRKNLVPGLEVNILRDAPARAQQALPLASLNARSESKIFEPAQAALSQLRMRAQPPARAGWNLWLGVCGERRSALRELDARVEAGSRRADHLAQANPPAETPLAVEDLAALAGAHAGPKADLPDALDVADLTWMMHGEVLLATAASGLESGIG